MNRKKIDVYLHQTLINLSKELYLSGDYEIAVDLISKLAYIEARNYIGYLSSVQMEKTLVNIASKIFPCAIYKKKNNLLRKVLHIATELYTIGGHTKVLLDWSKNDSNSISEIILTNQIQPFQITEDIPVFKLSNSTAIDKASELRQHLENNYYDVYVLHQHMEDVVPTLALWDTKKELNNLILFYNHANFRFSLGNIVTHKRVNICHGDVVISRKYRYSIEDVVLNFVLGDKMPQPLIGSDLRSIKTQLEILDYEVVFFSIGSAYKYTPFREQNFLAEWNSFLLRNNQYVMIIVGCNQLDFDKNCPNTTKAPNLILKGNVKNPTKYYQIADYIVDIYPLQTGLGTLTGLYYGVPPIFPYSATAMVLGEEMNKLYPQQLFDFFEYDCVNSYFEFIKEEAETKAYYLSTKDTIRNYVSNYLLKKPWIVQLEKIYSSTNKKIDLPSVQQDIYNDSKASSDWYEFSSALKGSFDIIELVFEFGVRFKFKLLRYYLFLILLNKKVRGTRLKKFMKYFFNLFCYRKSN